MSNKAEEYIKEILELRGVIIENDVLKLFPDTRDKIEDLFKSVSNREFDNGYLYNLEVEILESLVKGAFVNINTYNKEEKVLKIVAVKGMQEMVEMILKVSKINMIGKSLQLKDKYAEISLLQGKIHRIPRGLKDAALKGFPEILVDLLDDIFGPFYCYGAGFIYKGDLVGNCAIIGRNVIIDDQKENIINSVLPVFATVDMIYKSLDK